MKKIKEIIDLAGWPRIIIAMLLVVLFFAAPFVQVGIFQSISDIIRRFCMTSLLVLAMVPMVQSGCGLNFGIQIGIIAGLLGSTFAMNMQFTGISGFVVALLVTIAFGV